MTYCDKAPLIEKRFLFKNISVISFIFYSYQVFLVARGFAYPQDNLLHISASAASLLIYLVFILDLPFLESFINRFEIYFSTYIRKKVLITILFIYLSAGLLYSLFKNTTFDELGILEVSSIVSNNGLKIYSSIPWGSLGKMSHPPLVVFMDSFVTHIFGAHLYILRIICLIFSILILIFVYLIGKKLYNREIGLLSMIFLMLSQLYFRISCSASLDIPLLFFFIASIYLFLNYLDAHKLVYAFLCSFFLALGLYTKYCMVLIYPVLLIYLLLTRDFFYEIKRCGIWVIFIAPIITFLPWLFVFLTHISLEQSNTIISFASRLILQNKIAMILYCLFDLLPSGIGAQNIPFFIIGLIKVSKEKAKSNKFILAWIILSIFLMLPFLIDMRYLLPIFPAITILMSHGLVATFYSRLKVILLSALYLFITSILYIFASSEGSRFIATLHLLI